MGTPFQHRVTDMYTLSWASQVAQWVKDPPAVQETEETQADACRIDPRVRKIPWRRAWQPTPVFLPGESHWTEEPGGLHSMGSQRIGHD